MAGINFIRRYVMNQMKKTADDGIMITLPDKNKVDLNISITVDRLIRNGFNPDAFTSPQQVDNALNMINTRMVNRAIPADSPEGREITEKLFGRQKAPVFDMEGNRIPEESGIMGGKSIKDLIESGQVTKGTVNKKSKKVTDREMFKAANKRLTSDVNSIIKNIKSMEPLTAMKEANSVIARKGKYKNLTPEQSKKILQDTEDHIFERDIPETEDFAAGGRAGLRFGGDTMGGRNDRSRSSPGPDRSRVSDRQQANHERAMSDRSNQGNRDYSPIKQIAKQTAISTAKNLGTKKLMNVLGLSKFTNPLGIALVLKGAYDRAKNPVFTEEDMTLGLITDQQKGIIDKQGNIGKLTGAFDPDSTFDAAKQFDDEGSSGILGIGGRDAEPMTREEFDNYVKEKGYSTGGRAGFMAGGMGRRGFLKMLAGLGAGIGAVKSGIIGLGGKQAGKEVAKEIVQKSTTTPPPYFFKLAEKIKKFGSDSTPTTERTISKSLKSKDGTADYVLEEDMVTGNIQIKKVNMERDDMINDIEIMEFRKGEVVKGPDGKPIRTPDEYDEVTESISRIYKDSFNDPDYSEGIRVKEVMEEVMDAPSIKKADGGIMRAGYQSGGRTLGGGSTSPYEGPMKTQEQFGVNARFTDQQSFDDAYKNYTQKYNDYQSNTSSGLEPAPGRQLGGGPTPQQTLPDGTPYNPGRPAPGRQPGGGGGGSGITILSDGTVYNPGRPPPPGSNVGLGYDKPMPQGIQPSGELAYDATNTDIYGSSAASFTPKTITDPLGNQVQAGFGKTPGMQPGPSPIRPPIRPGPPTQGGGNPFDPRFTDNFGNQGPGRQPGGVPKPPQTFPDGTPYNPGFPAPGRQLGGGPSPYAGPMKTQEQFGANARFTDQQAFDDAYKNYQQRYNDYQLNQGSQQLELPSQQLAPNYGDSPLASTVRTNMLSGGIARMLGE